MPVEVRRYKQGDADALAALFARNAYGPAEAGRVLTGEGLEAVFRERLVTDCFVGVDGERIHGCIALSVGSGRRTTSAEQRFAGLFVIDSAHRRSMLAGKLFREIFMAPSVENGIRALRIEANPANRRAFPLYLRVGFRSVSAARADHEGYTELVSHLPGATRDLLSYNRGEHLDSAPPKLNWRMMRGGRDTEATWATTDLDGRVVVDYLIDTGDLEFQVVMDHHTGNLVAIQQTRGPMITLPEASPVHLAAPPQTIWHQHLVDGVSVRVRDDGLLTLERGTETLLSEWWPVVVGDDAPAVRRQGRRRAVRITAEEDGRFRFTDPDDLVERLIGVSADSRQITLRAVPLRPDATVISTPWIRMGVAQHGALLPGMNGDVWRGGPVLPGLWPPGWTDFEAACPDSDAVATWWSDGTTGLRCEWTGRARLEGRSAPAVRSSHEGEGVEHRFHVNPDIPMMEDAVAFRAVPPPIRRRQSRHTPPQVPPVISAPHVLHSGNDVTITGVSQSMRIAADAGIIDWRVNDIAVLGGPYPSGGTWGSLTRRRTGLWCAMLAPRDDLDQGVEWAGDADSLPFSKTEAPGTWTVVPADGPWMEVIMDGADQDRENAVHIVPFTEPTPEFVVRIKSRVWRVAPGSTWQGSVTAAAVALRDGRALVVQPMEAERPEVFLRSHPAGAQLVALGRGTSPLRVKVMAMPSLGSAEQVLASGGTHGGQRV